MKDKKCVIIAIVSMFLEMMLIFIAGCGIPHSLYSVKLSDCSASVLHMPLDSQGNNVHLVLGIPGEQTKDQIFKGNIIIQESKKMVYESSFDAKDLMSANWLDHEHLNGYILTSVTGKLMPLDGFVKAGVLYEVIIRFHDIPPAGSSIWLCYLAGEPPVAVK